MLIKCFFYRYNESITDEFKSDSQKFVVAQEALEYYKLRSLITEGGENMRNVALPSDFVLYPGDRKMNWKGKGFQIFFDVLSKKYPNSSQDLPFKGKILLNKEVTKISWGPHFGQALKIRCSDKSIYNADHVIFTPSVGVLKEKHEQLFEPVLPTEKQEAIKNIGFGSIMKIFAYYSDQWWQDNEEFHLIWNKNDLENVKTEFTDGPIVVSS